jgi:hypothetical protein
MAKSPRKKRDDAIDTNEVANGEYEVMLMADGSLPPMNMDDPGVIEIPHEDGSVTIDLNPQRPKPENNDKFDANIAEKISPTALSKISADLLEAISQDETDRNEWIQQRSDGLELLGQKIEKPGAGNVGSSSTAVPGQSTVRDGLLAEACDRFQANAFAELCPAEGPCKIVNYGAENTATDDLAQSLEKDFNYYLTGAGPNTAKEYYPDTRKMLWWTGYASGMFKKVYRCPVRNRPVSESVDGADLIVPSNVTDLHNAGRITHQINMRQTVMKRMQILGVYRDVPLSAPTPTPSVLKTAEADVVGMNPRPQREEDQDYTIYECYCELDIEGFEHKMDGEPSGLALPYRVTIDKDSRTILEVRRNWKQPEKGEEDKLPVAKIPFVLFPYATGIGFYGTGLLHRLGNYTMALTAMLRECIDAGMFANFPGFLFAKPMGRQLQNEFRVPPGGGAPIDVSAVGGNINNAVMPLPYKDVSTAVVALMQQTRENASRYGGTAEGPTGEGVANAPVGSVLAAIDQSTRIEGGVHKALYAAQREEFALLKELFREDPDALWRGNKRPAMGNDAVARRAKFLAAIENCDLVPASDPNVPSHMHRLAKATTYLQTAMALPGVFNMQKVIKRWAGMVKIDDIEADFAPQNAPQPDPVVMAQLALEGRKVAVMEQKAQLDAAAKDKAINSKEQIETAKLAIAHFNANKPAEQQQVDPLQARALDLKHMQIEQAGQKMAVDAHNAKADRHSREAVEAMKIASVVGVHPESDALVDEQLQQMSAFLDPAVSGHADGGAVGVDPDVTPQEEQALRLTDALTQYLERFPRSALPN